MTTHSGWEERGSFWHHSYPGSGHTVQVQVTDTGLMPGIWGRTSKVRTTWIRMNFEMWCRVDGNPQLRDVLAQATDIEWVREVVRNWLEGDEAFVVHPELKTHCFRGRNDVYLVHQHSQGGHVRNRRGTLVAHFEASPSKGKLKDLQPPKGQYAVPQGLREFLDGLLESQRTLVHRPRF